MPGPFFGGERKEGVPPETHTVVRALTSAVLRSPLLLSLAPLVHFRELVVIFLVFSVRYANTRVFFWPQNRAAVGMYIAFLEPLLSAVPLRFFCFSTRRQLFFLSFVFLISNHRPSQRPLICVMVSLGGRPWGTDLKAPVAVAVVLLAVAAWKVSTKKRETKNKKHAKSFVCLSFCVVPIREREPAPSAKGARGKMASFLVASSRASRSRLCVDAGIAHATVLPEAGRTKDN